MLLTIGYPKLLVLSFLKTRGGARGTCPLGHYAAPPLASRMSISRCQFIYRYSLHSSFFFGLKNLCLCHLVRGSINWILDTSPLWLQALSKRIHYGKFVAEAKFRESPTSYEAPIRAQVYSTFNCVLIHFVHSIIMDR